MVVKMVVRRIAKLSEDTRPDLASAGRVAGPPIRAIGNISTIGVRLSHAHGRR
jgi:hypothetical protein